MSRPSKIPEILIAAIRAAGTIRTGELSKVTGITPNNIGNALSIAVLRREVIVCKVSSPVGRPCNEYRIGSGLPDTFKPLNTKAAGIALGTPSHRGGTAPAVALSTPKPAAKDIESSTFSKKPQPAVGNTGSTRSASSVILPEARAVAADPATPKPEARAQLKEEPAASMASAGDALDITLDDKGTLTIATCEGVIELQPLHAKRLGHFMVGSQGVWNPF